mmetsp:Transcript_409/g.308  ORF Transcript_409/g.308 Transcript_409/m.308 type:complete len:544 (-) Transcript_409:59-1690(-)
MAGMDQFEIELVPSETPVRKKRCFPCEACPCCPPHMLAWIPKQWHLLQSWTHLWMVLGVISSIGLTIDAIMSVWSKVKGKERVSIFFLQEIMTLVFMLPCLTYFIRTVEQYDADLRDKEKAAQIERQKLVNSYMETLGDMDNILNQTSETNAGFAERAFENQRRDFIRFLERIQGNFSSKSKESVDRMRTFCLHWFRVFSQCSIDPIRQPMKVVDEEELNMCVTMDEICALCLERLRTAEVRVITKQLQLDATEIQVSKNRFKTHAKVGVMLKKAKLKPWALAEKVAARGVHYLRGVSWLTFGFGQQSIEQDATGDDDDGYPKVINFKCGCLVLLSREHMSLILAFLVGWGLLALEQFTPGTQRKILACLAVTQFCLACILVRFEAVDIIQRFAREKRKLEKEKEAVHAKQREMQEFWKTAQQVTDLWLHRSVPCLELHHEIQTHIQDMSKRDAIEALASVNARLEEMDVKLGPLKDWFQDGDISDAAKKQFGAALGDVVGEEHLRGIEFKLNLFVNNVDQILNISTPQPARSMVPSMTLSMR